MTPLRGAGSSYWPVSLEEAVPGVGCIVLRPLSRGDEHRYLTLRLANQEWLAPWEPTTPEFPRVSVSATGFRDMARQLLKQARQGTALPWLIWYGEANTQDARPLRLVGQLTVAPIQHGSARQGTIGYWMDAGHAGRGIMPAAVAMAVDYCLLERGLHRIEINIRPENAPSLRVVQKLGFRYEGRRRGLLHIAGEWADHDSFAITTEEIGTGLLQNARSQKDIG